MGVVKYESLGMDYPLKDTPAMDKKRMPELRAAVLAGMKEVRAGK